MRLWWRRMMRLCLAALLLGGYAGAEDAVQDAAPAQDVDLNDESTLADYLVVAARDNEALKAAFNRWEAALERIPQARSLPDPRFTYTYFVESVETRVGPQKQKFGIMQVFPWFGKRDLRGDAASESAAAARQGYEKVKLRLFYRVQAAYHEYWYLGRAIDVTKVHVRLVTNVERVARTRFKAGSVPHGAVIQAQVELGKLDDRVRTLVALRAPLVAGLNAALNRPTHLPLPWPRELPSFDVSFTDEQARERLAENNPDLRRLDHLAEKEEAGIKLAGRNYYPDITLGVDYVDTDNALNPDMADSGKDPVMAMVSVNVPIRYGTYRAAEREARFRKAAAEADRNNTEKRLEADLELALYRFRDAERKIGLYGDTLVHKAEQSMKVAQQAFEAGSASFISLIDAQRLLLEFQLAHRRAQADRGQRLAEIEMMIGKQMGDCHEGHHH